MKPKVVRWLLTGKNTHANPTSALKGLAWETAGRIPEGGRHSVFQIVNHMIYWQDIYLRRVAGWEAPSPKAPSDGWPGDQAPKDEAEWLETIKRFSTGVREARHLAEGEDFDTARLSFYGMTVEEGLGLLAVHNSYHTGQIVTIRQMLGAWPEPSDEW